LSIIRPKCRKEWSCSTPCIRYRPSRRPISPADKALLADEFEHLSDESRYRRFLGPHLSLTPRELRYFTEIDHDRHEAIRL